MHCYENATLLHKLIIVIIIPCVIDVVVLLLLQQLLVMQKEEKEGEEENKRRRKRKKNKKKKKKKKKKNSNNINTEAKEDGRKGRWQIEQDLSPYRRNTQNSPAPFSLAQQYWFCLTGSGECRRALYLDHQDNNNCYTVFLDNRICLTWLTGSAWHCSELIWGNQRH